MITKIHIVHFLLPQNRENSAESLLYSLEHTATCIGLYVNAEKKELMRFKQDGRVSSLNVSAQKLVDLFPYICSNILSTESDTNINIGNTWATSGRLATEWKSDHWWNKTWILRNCNRDRTIEVLHHLEFYETTGEKFKWGLPKDYVWCFEWIQEATYLPSYKPFNTKKTCWGTPK